MVKKVCRKCKIFVEKDLCPICNNADYVDSWKGRIIVLDPVHSVLAKKAGITVKGEYAIKTR